MEFLERTLDLYGDLIALTATRELTKGELRVKLNIENFLANHFAVMAKGAQDALDSEMEK